MSHKKKPKGVNIGDLMQLLSRTSYPNNHLLRNFLLKKKTTHNENFIFDLVERKYPIGRNHSNILLTTSAAHPGMFHQ